MQFSEKLHLVEMSNTDHRYILNKMILNVTRLTRSTQTPHLPGTSFKLDSVVIE